MSAAAVTQYLCQFQIPISERCKGIYQICVRVSGYILLFLPDQIIYGVKISARNRRTILQIVSAGPVLR